MKYKQVPLIVRYNENVQIYCKAKTKPEPWMHCAMIEDGYDIYVWDTREVIETGKLKSMPQVVKDASFTFAEDNLQALNGKNCTSKAILAMAKLRDDAMKSMHAIFEMYSSFKVIASGFNQAIYQNTSFAAGHYYTWRGWVKFLRKQPFKKTEEVTKTIIRLYVSGSADTTIDLTRLFNSDQRKYADIKSMFANLGFNIDDDEVRQGYTPLPMH